VAFADKQPNEFLSVHGEQYIVVGYVLHFY